LLRVIEPGANEFLGKLPPVFRHVSASLSHSHEASGDFEFEVLSKKVAGNYSYGHIVNFVSIEGDRLSSDININGDANITFGKQSVKFAAQASEDILRNTQSVDLGAHVEVNILNRIKSLIRSASFRQENYAMKEIFYRKDLVVFDQPEEATSNAWAKSKGLLGISIDKDGIWNDIKTDVTKKLRKGFHYTRSLWYN
jgi:hypothetical protein